MKPTDFFATHPVFSYDEFVAAHTSNGKRSRHTSASSLKQHVAGGNLLRIRRGLYATVPRGVDPDHAMVDPYLLTTKLTDDATVAYHAALQFHAKAYSVWRRFHYLTRLRSRPLSFRGAEFLPVQAPAAVRNLPELGGGIVEKRHAGGVVRVATLERTLVDALDEPNKSGGWEEVWRSLEMVEYFDLDAVVEYAVKLGSALTVARVGFFLAQHRETLMVEEHHLRRLRQHAPAQPRYLDSTRQPGKLMADWNLVVPLRVLERRWEQA
ncbi:MAG: hypothetical protein PVJ43_14880 [Gemmatimonadales bacterium]|jgi:predicted transcriptional regulator of viral defense system